MDTHTTTSPDVTVALALGVGSLLLIGSERLRIPALLPLLGAGLVLGRSGLGIVSADSLGDLLNPIITLAIGLLVYEGALHLTWRELRKAPRAVGGLISTGVVLTWVLVAGAAVLTLGYGWPTALLMGAMLTVTGPTVVQPILRRLRVTPRLRTALSAEAVLTDPIGVLLTIVVLSMLKGAATTAMTTGMFVEGARHLGFQVVAGVGVGLAMGLVSLLAAYLLSVKGRIGPRPLNILAIGSCMAAVGVGEMIAPEAGLVAAVVSAMCLGSLRRVGVSDLHQFGEQLASITVAALFILLASRFDVRSLADAGWREALFLGAIVFVVRPISAGAALIGSTMSARERTFAMLFAPRGVVALSVAVIASHDLARFAAQLGDARVEGSLVDLDRLVENAATLERVMFILIVGTVAWASLGGIVLGRWLRVGGSRPAGMLLVGGHALSLQTASVLKRLGVEVTVIDTRFDHVLRAESTGAIGIRGDATDLRWMEESVGTDDIGLVLAWTGNRDVDLTVARWAAERFGADGAALWAAGQVPPDANWIELGGGRLLDEVHDEIESKRWRVESWPMEGESRAAPASMSVVAAFLAVRDGRPRFLVPHGADDRAPAPGSTLVGLVKPDERAAADDA